ncbi:pro-opiomelanocortin [Molothrus ater]|uniref:pro-opiomelanocortin n=1 Tax=Molothrus ater TaxID=84834 RepID=UPI0023E84A8B|nr:pro-opiomelanocortin [Molothrus ater]
MRPESWNSQCRELSNEAGILACAGSCRAQISLESPVFPGNGQFQPLSEGLRRYVMSHFRWNQFGRKNATEPGKRQGEEAEAEAEAEKGPGNEGGIPGFFRHSGKDGKRSYSMEHFRWGKPVGRKRRPVKVYPNGAEEESEENSRLEFRREEPTEEEDEEDEEEEGFPKFPWNSRKEKRYGGFMSPERIRTPLVTLFKNAIGKSFSKDGQ